MGKVQKLLLEKAPEFIEGDGKTLLYIGARHKKFSWSQVIQEAKYKIHVLEIFKKNVKTLQTFDFIEEVYYDDIRTTTLDKEFDVVIWHAGPEHVTKEEFKDASKNIDRLCTSLSILVCPDGPRPQGIIYGNKWEKHVAEYTKEDLEQYGYEVTPYEKGPYKYLLAIKHFNKDK